MGENLGRGGGLGPSLEGLPLSCWAQKGTSVEVMEKACIKGGVRGGKGGGHGSQGKRLFPDGGLGIGSRAGERSVWLSTGPYSSEVRK